MALVMEIDEQVLAAKFDGLLPHLDERQRRLTLAAEARSLGHGGISLVARAAGVARKTVAAGVDELDSGEGPLGRTRRSGGGRKQLTELDPSLVDALDELVEPETRGDPMTRLRWTTKSTRNLADELERQGHQVSHHSVARLLSRVLKYSLQANAKTLEGRQHPDRDAQFGYINEQVTRRIAAGQPVISVDVAADQGWVSVGSDGDTAQFAVETIRRWWYRVGQLAYPDATELLICADAGGSNGYRIRLWKVELAKLADETGLAITVCHMPPGTSKWNKIEHRLFSHISMNWAGQPLTSHDVVVNLIAGTTTRTGLTVQAERDHGTYPRGIKIPDREMRDIIRRYLQPHKFHAEWNYTIRSTAPADTP